CMAARENEERATRSSASPRHGSAPPVVHWLSHAATRSRRPSPCHTRAPGLRARGTVECSRCCARWRTMAAARNATLTPHLRTEESEMTMDVATNVRTLQNYVAGAWRDSAAAETLPVPNPATGETQALVPLSTAEDVGAAVSAARDAFATWQTVPVIERVQVLFRLKALLDKRHDDLAHIVTQENGKTHSEAWGEVRRGIEVVEFACGAPSLMQGRSLADVSRGIDTTMQRFPLGVVAGISPF